MNPFVRRVLFVDGIVSLVFGIALLALAGPIAARFALPGAIPVEIAGAVCIAYAPLLLLASRREVSPRQLMLLAGGNAAWVALSLIAAALAPMNALGRGFVVAQALLVAEFFLLETSGLRQRPAVR